MIVTRNLEGIRVFWVVMRQAIRAAGSGGRAVGAATVRLRRGHWSLPVLALVLVAAVGVGVWAGRDGASPTAAAGSAARPSARYAAMPLAFAPNRGEAPNRVRFVARAAHSTVALTRRAAVLSLANSRGTGTKDARVALRFAGDATPKATVTGARGLPGTVNYLVGRRSAWLRGLPTFGRVVYHGLWPGIAAVFYGHRGRLEYDFDVAPGADPSAIGLDVRGARGVRVTPSGALAIRVPGGTVRQLAPHAYQTIGGRRRTVAAHYVISDRGRVRVRVGAYDHHRPLVIDPVLEYSTYLGGMGADRGDGIAVDAQGAAYVTGSTTGDGFPVKNAEQATPGAGADAFVTKLSPDGQSLEYSTYLGGVATQIGDTAEGHGIAVGAGGAAYVTGQTDQIDFPTKNAVQPTLGGGSAHHHTAVFVTELSPDGRRLVYSTYLGGDEAD